VNLEGVGVNNTLSVTGGNLARPIGTKAAKQQLKDDRSTAILQVVRTQEISSFASSVSSLAASHKMVAASYFRKVDLKVIAELR
jgi:predicted phage gp36 major capsid-like protein